jgi:chemotaxis protein histidine kinase CheA
MGFSAYSWGHPKEVRGLVSEVKLYLGRVRQLCRAAGAALNAADLHLLRLEGDPRDKESLHALRRMLRSVSIRSRALGLSDAHLFAGAREALVRKTFERQTPLSNPELDLLFDSVDVLKRYFQFVHDAATTGSALSPGQSLRALQRQVSAMGAPSRVAVSPDRNIAESTSCKRLGELLTEDGHATREQLNEALRIQRIPSAQWRIGDILNSESGVPRSQLERAAVIQGGEGNTRPLGEILIDLGTVESADVGRALAKQKTSQPPPLGEVLVRLGAVPAKTVAQTIRQQRAVCDLARYGLAWAPQRIEGDSKTAQGGLRYEKENGIYRDFVVRTEDHLDQAELLLLHLELDPEDAQALKALSGIFHAIERVARFLALEDIRSFCHEAGRLVDRVQEGSVQLDDALCDLLFDAVQLVRRHGVYVEAALVTEGALMQERGLPQCIQCIRHAAEGRRVGISVKRLRPCAVGKRLGEILLESGVATQAQLDRALSAQAQSRDRLRLGDVLVEEAYLNWPQLRAALDAQQREPALGRLGDILVAWGIMSRAEVEAARDRQEAPPHRPKLGELLVRAGAVSAKTVARALRRQRAALAQAGAAAVFATTILAPSAQSVTAYALEDPEEQAATAAPLAEVSTDTKRDALSEAIRALFGADSTTTAWDPERRNEAWETSRAVPSNGLSSYAGDGPSLENLFGHGLETPAEAVETDSNEDPGRRVGEQTASQHADLEAVQPPENEGTGISKREIRIVTNAFLGLQSPTFAGAAGLKELNSEDVLAVIQSALNASKS